MKTVLAATALLLTSIGAANAQDLDQQMQNFDRGMMGPPSVDQQMQNFDQRMMGPGGNNLIIMPNGRAW